ncbi:MAG: hypothetical protein IPG67_17020 [Acidobacteria bacterium]|nr:hypothetical protein [Acidobacteriota bacterium]
MRRPELENLRHQINEIEKTRASYVDAQAHLQTNEVDKYERRLDNLSRDYLRKGGQLAEEREKVESDRRELIGKLNETNTALVDLAGGVFPLFLVKALLSKIHSQVHVELQADQNDLILTTLEERDEAPLDSLKSIELSSVIRAYWNNISGPIAWGGSNTLKIDRFIELSPHGNAQLRSLLNGDVLKPYEAKIIVLFGVGSNPWDRNL